MQTRSPGTNFLSFTSTVSVVVVAGTDFEYILGAGINDFLARREPSCFLSSWKAMDDCCWAFGFPPLLIGMLSLEKQASVRTVDHGSNRNKKRSLLIFLFSFERVKEREKRREGRETEIM